MRGLAQGRMRRVLNGLLPAAVIGLGLAAGTAPQPAAAQFFGEWGGGSWSGGWGGGNWGGLRSGEISREMAQQGFRVIAPIRRKGAVFIADVIDRRGHRERLIVAAADAQILQRFYLDDPRLPGTVPRDALAGRNPDAPMDRADRGDAMLPPGNIPAAPRQGRGQAYGAPSDDSDQAYGTDGFGRGTDNGQDDGLEPVRPRALPPKPLKPKPRLVDRTPDPVPPQNDALPAQAPRARLPAVEPDQAGDHPAAAPPARLANRPPEPAKPSVAPAPSPAPAAPSSTTTRLRDPLAIPGGEPKAAAKSTEQPRASATANTPPRVVPGVTGAAAPAPAKPAAAASKSGDVPVAPLD